MDVVFMFPGQSSRYPGMLGKMCALRAENRAIVERASRLLDWDLERHFAGEQPFHRNVDVQVGVFLTSHLFLETLQAAGVTAEISLGLSLGEYNHLVHIGALSFEDALLTVRARGEAYDAGPRGMMASVQPLDLATVEAVIAEVREQGVVEVSNYNSPTQHVLSGEHAAVEAAIRVLEEEHYVQTVVIERQVPMHSSLFRNVAVAFRRYLNNLNFTTPSRPYLPNRIGEFVARPSRETFVQTLAEHVHTPVLWRRSVEAVVARFPDAVFVEVGPLAVLHNLLSRRWCKRPKFFTDGAGDLSEHLAALATRLHAGPIGARKEVSCTTP
ncbi:MAG: ACP S-malonyltransferase [Myxococcales bacterium FL481]|nr:MAG: ACP S-malonyltransferase [Myxococcales bacterium FL481]